MQPIDIIIMVILSISLLGIIAYLIWQKEQGKNGCGCGCNTCPSAGTCHRATKQTEQEKTPETDGKEQSGA